MTWSWAAASIRARLTGWYAGALTVMLLVYAAATYLAVRHEFLEQLDDQLHDDFETAERLFVQTAEGRIGWAVDAHHEDDSARVYDLWSATGDQIHHSGPPVSLPPLALAPTATTYRYQTIGARGGRWRALSGPISVGGHAMILRVSRPEERVRAQLQEILVVLVLGLPLVVVLAGAGGYVLARRALRPIDHLASEARRITAERLHQRLTVPNQTDEIGRLAAVINGVFARLESSFAELRRFTADASHELRTPLAVVRGVGEAAVAETRTAPEYEEAIGSMLEEVDRLTHLVDTLLRLAHGDAGAIPLAPEPVDLGQLARDVASSLGILADERGQTIDIAAAEPVVVAADRLVIREAVTNVLDNAIKYSPNGSTIVIRVDRQGEHGVMAVADQGPGIPLPDRERIFQRFFRVDEARSRERGGAGLGLSIARWAVDIHGGRIVAGEGRNGGAEFQIVLPLASPVRAEQQPRRVHAAGHFTEST